MYTVVWLHGTEKNAEVHMFVYEYLTVIVSFSTVVFSVFMTILIY